MNYKEEMVSLKNLNVKVGDFSLSNVNFNIKKGEYFVILGPSGNGKTVLVKSIAGLLDIQSGEIWIGGTRKDHLPPENRGIGFVFQDHVLFPHMSVFDNIAFGWRLRKTKKDVIKKKVEDIALVLHISHLLNRNITNLSGGEKQRVALARAVILNPDLLIMDEPYASMDRNLAEELIMEGRDLHQEIKKTTIHITHNHEEAATLADKIGIMDKGKIRMIGTPNEVFQKPNSVFVADFLCTENIYDNASIESKEEHALINYKEKQLYCNKNRVKNGKVVFCIRPGSVLLTGSHPKNGCKNVFKGTLQRIYDKGGMFQCIVDVGFKVVIRMMRTKFFDIQKNQGEPVYVTLPEDKIHIIGSRS